MRSFLWFLLIALLGVTSVVKPDLNVHRQKIYETATGSPAPATADLALLPEWKDLKFRDFYFVTVTQSIGRETIVSYGVLRYIKVVNPDWWANPHGKKPVSID